MDKVYYCDASGQRDDLTDTYTANTDQIASVTGAADDYHLFHFEITDIPEASKWFISHIIFILHQKAPAVSVNTCDKFACVGNSSNVIATLDKATLAAAGNVICEDAATTFLGDDELKDTVFKVATNKLDPNVLLTAVRMGYNHLHINVKLPIGQEYRTHLCNENVKPRLVIKYTKVKTTYTQVNGEVVEVN